MSTKHNILTLSAVAMVVSTLLCATSCKQESIQDLAEKSAKDATRKLCPTPFVGYMRTDSIVFDRQKNIFTYYSTISDSIVIDESNKGEIEEILRSSAAGSTSMKQYIESGFHIRYVCREEKEPYDILMDVMY